MPCASSAMATSSGRMPTKHAAPSCSGRDSSAPGAISTEKLGMDEPGPAVGGRDRDRQEVHRRAADDGRDEAVGRAVVDVLGGRHLLDDALAEHGDAVGHAHRLDLVVRHVDERPAEVALQALELRAHLEPEQGVERGERLVEEQRPRVADERPTERDALPLAARQLPRLALEQMLDVQRRGGLLDALPDLVPRQLRLLEREGEVVRTPTCPGRARGSGT